MILAVVMLLGLGVRMYGLTGYGIWFDEGYHIALVQLPTVGAMVDALISNPPSDPLYVMLLRAWVGLFGHDNAAVRMLSVLASTSTLPAIYLLGRQAASNTIGLLGALLFALSPYAVELGQEAALYSLAALTTTAALTAGWRWRTTGRGRAAYMVFAVLAIYSHYVVAVILILFAAFSLHPAAGPRKVSARTWVISNAAIGVLWLPWLAALAVHWWSSALTRTALRHPATAAELFDALVQYTSGSAALHVQNRWLETLGLAVGAALFTMGLGMLHPWSGRLRLVAVIAAIVFAGPAIVSTLTGLWLFVPHFMLFLLPALVLIQPPARLRLSGFGGE